MILGILGFCFLVWVLYKCCELAEDDGYQENYVNQTERNTQPKYELNPTRVNDAKLTAVDSQNLRQENNFNSAAINMPAKPEFDNLPSTFQTNTYGENKHMTPSRYSLGEPSGSQTERQENDLNPAFNPTFNPTAIEMPSNPEYEARNNFPSNIQTNTYEANNYMTPSSNLPDSLGEPIGNPNGRQENNINPPFNPMFNSAAIEMPANSEYEARNNFPSNSSNLPYSLTPGEANGNQNGSEPTYAGGWVNQK